MTLIGHHVIDHVSSSSAGYLLPHHLPGAGDDSAYVRHPPKVVLGSAVSHPSAGRAIQVSFPFCIPVCGLGMKSVW